MSRRYRLPESKHRKIEELAIQYRAFLTCPNCNQQMPMTIDGLDWMVRSPEDIGTRLIGQFRGVKQEQIHTLVMSIKGRVLKQEIIYQGSVSQALVRIAEVIRPAIQLSAPGLIIVHNHPSGDPTPSPDDLHLTNQVLEACRLMDLNLLDHLVIGADSYVSMRDRGIEFS